VRTFSTGSRPACGRPPPAAVLGRQRHHGTGVPASPYARADTDASMYELHVRDSRGRLMTWVIGREVLLSCDAEYPPFPGAVCGEERNGVAFHHQAGRRWSTRSSAQPPSASAKAMSTARPAGASSRGERPPRWRGGRRTRSGRPRPAARARWADECQQSVGNRAIAVVLAAGSCYASK